MARKLINLPMARVICQNDIFLIVDIHDNWIVQAIVKVLIFAFQATETIFSKESALHDQKNYKWLIVYHL